MGAFQSYDRVVLGYGFTVEQIGRNINEQLDELFQKDGDLKSNIDFKSMCIHLIKADCYNQMYNLLMYRITTNADFYNIDVTICSHSSSEYPFIF